jgi:hypothetical protein
MDVYEPRRKKESKARQRYNARQRKRGAMAEKHVETDRRVVDFSGVLSPSVDNMRQRIGIALQDFGWYLRHNPIYLWAVVGAVLVIALLYFLSFLITGRVAPGVRAMDTSLSGMSLAEAEGVLLSAWQDSATIALLADGEVVANVHPGDLGVRFDAYETAKDAQGVGLSALPFGKTVPPVVEVDTLSAQGYLLDLSNVVNTSPYTAGFEWRDNAVHGVMGYDGRMLDIPLTIEKLAQNLASTIQRGRLELLMIPIPPERRDPTPFVDQVTALIEQAPELSGYDPFTNQYFTWPVPLEQFVSWLAAGPAALELRYDEFEDYVQAINQTLNEPGEQLRYLQVGESLRMMNEAIERGDTRINLRVRYREQTYEVIRGDTAFSIGRKTGIPFRLIRDANPDKDLDWLYPGDELIIPPLDLVMPNDPVPHKRIIVDLDRLYLVAYENGQPIFQWQVSSGVDGAPTSPGTYQILNHDNNAVGSSVNICQQGGLQCGQWEMSWFMGIYEVSPGLLNGFHGRVLLPNGNYLGDGAIGQRNTFGCVMSTDEQARLLYDWAEVGTVVEIISSEYTPKSDLGQHALSISQSNA